VGLDPKVGSVGVIAECARNLACVGAEAVGATDCLNFGNPERPEIMWQFAQSIDGLAEGCHGLSIPIVSGNVSLYNETDGKGILPTPSVAMVGLVEGEIPSVRSRFGRAGLEVAVLGAEARHGVGGSSWMSWLHGQDRGRPPAVDLPAEKALHQAVIQLVRSGLVEVAHDVADGGLALALAEACTGSRQTASVGFQGELPGEGTLAGRLFGEDHGRVVIAYAPEQRAAVKAAIGAVSLRILGRTGGDRLVVGPVDVAVSALEDAWKQALPAYMNGNAAWRRGQG